MPNEDQELLMMAYQHWAKGKSQKMQMAELFIMLSHAIGTIQYLLEHFGLTELPGSDKTPSTVNTVNSTASGDDGIDLAVMGEVNVGHEK